MTQTAPSDDFTCDRFELDLEVPAPPVDAFQGRPPFLSVYSPVPAPMMGMRDQYGLYLPLECVPRRLALQVYGRKQLWRENNPYYAGTWLRASSFAKPEVVPVTSKMLALQMARTVNVEALREAQEAAADRLVLALQRLDARNLSRDRVFDRRPLRVSLLGLRYGSDEGLKMGPAPRDIARRVEGTFKLIPTKVWVYLED